MSATVWLTRRLADRGKDKAKGKNDKAKMIRQKAKIPRTSALPVGREGHFLLLPFALCLLSFAFGFHLSFIRTEQKSIGAKEKSTWTKFRFIRTKEKPLRTKASFMWTKEKFLWTNQKSIGTKLRFIRTNDESEG